LFDSYILNLCQLLKDFNFPMDILGATNESLNDGSLPRKIDIALSWAESQPKGAHWAFVLEHMQVYDSLSESFAVHLILRVIRIYLNGETNCL